MSASRITTLLLLLFAPLASGQDTLRRVRIQAEDAPALASRFEAEGCDVLEGAVQATSLELVVSVAELGELDRLGYAPEVLEIGQPFAQKQAADGGVAGYPDLTQIYAQMAAWEASFPNLAQVVDLTAKYGLPPTEEGRNLFALKVSDNVTLDEDEPALLVVSAHHSRETVTPVIALRMMESWLTAYGTVSSITQVIDEQEIWIAPVWNPDGYEHVFQVDNLWRKNRRVLPTATGVDLNRNYPQGWDTACAGSTDPTSLTYKGTSPASEAETRTMLTFAKDRHFARVIDFHSYGEEVLWGYACLTYPFDSFLMAEALALAAACGYTDERPPTAEGEHFEWAFAKKGSHSFLIETEAEFQPPFADALAEAQQVLPGILWMAERPIPISGHVTDACTGAPLEASIELVGVSFSNGETNGSGGPFGRYHVFVPEGSWTLEFSLAGYDAQQHVVNVPPGGSVELDVALEATAVATVSGSLSVGTQLALDVDAPVDAGQLYVAACGFSGTAPGISIGACVMPLNLDFLVLVSSASQPPFSGFSGVLDGAGHATGTLDLPSDPVLIGLSLDFAFLTIDAATAAFLHTSDPANAVLQP